MKPQEKKSRNQTHPHHLPPRLRRGSTKHTLEACCKLSRETKCAWLVAVHVETTHCIDFCSQVLEAEDLEPVLDVMKQNLMAKNVAAEIADDICQSVRSSLEGQKLASMTRYEEPKFCDMMQQKQLMM